MTHCHGSLLPGMEAKLSAALTSDGRPPTDGSEACGRNQPSLPRFNKSSFDFHPRTHTLPLADAHPAETQSTMKRGVTACHHCRATSPMQQLRLHVAISASTHPPGAKKHNRRRRHRSRDDNLNATPSGREQRRWCHCRMTIADRVFTLG